MTDRYVALDYGTHAYVSDWQEKRIVSRHHIIRDAEAEAARLNAAAGKRAAPVTAWAVIPTPKSGMSWKTYGTRAEARARCIDLRARLGLSECRIARVRIEEISDDE